MEDKANPHDVSFDLVKNSRIMKSSSAVQFDSDESTTQGPTGPTTLQFHSTVSDSDRETIN